MHFKDDYEKAVKDDNNDDGESMTRCSSELMLFALSLQEAHNPLPKISFSAIT